MNLVLGPFQHDPVRIRFRRPAVRLQCQTTEVKAVIETLRWLVSQEYTHACILISPKNILCKVGTGARRRKCVDFLTQSKARAITFIFVSGQKGVDGNEREDKLARLATVLEDQLMNRADILNALRHLARLEDFQMRELRSRMKMLAGFDL